MARHVRVIQKQEPQRQGEYVRFNVMMSRDVHKRIAAIRHHMDVFQNIQISQNLYIVKAMRWYLAIMKARAEADLCSRCKRKWLKVPRENEVSSELRQQAVPRACIQFKCPKDLYDQVRKIQFHFEQHQGTKVTQRALYDAGLATYTTAIEAQGNRNICPECLRVIRKPLPEETHTQGDIK